MTHKKHVCVRFNGFSVDFNIDVDLWKKYSAIAFEQHGIGGIKEMVGTHIAETVARFDGKGKGIEQYLDPNFIPIPELTSSINEKVRYLKTQNDNTIEKIMDESYRLHIMCKALLDSKNKEDFNMDYLAAWQRYK